MKVTISVSEPWQLGELLGWRSLAGHVITAASDSAGGQILIRLDKPLLWGGSNWNYLIGSPRYEGSSVAALNEPSGLISAMVGIPDDQAEGQQPFASRSKTSTGYFIGTILRSG
jgi:hypothetical protein